jgi:hypothetical protein
LCFIGGYLCTVVVMITVAILAPWWCVFVLLPSPLFMLWLHGRLVRCPWCGQPAAGRSLLLIYRYCYWCGKDL